MAVLNFSAGNNLRFVRQGMTFNFVNSQFDQKATWENVLYLELEDYEYTRRLSNFSYCSLVTGDKSIVQIYSETDGGDWKNMRIKLYDRADDTQIDSLTIQKGDGEQSSTQLSYKEKDFVDYHYAYVGLHTSDELGGIDLLDKELYMTIESWIDDEEDIALFESEPILVIDSFNLKRNRLQWFEEGINDESGLNFDVISELGGNSFYTIIEDSYIIYQPNETNSEVFFDTQQNEVSSDRQANRVMNLEIRDIPEWQAQLYYKIFMHRQVRLNGIDISFRDTTERISTSKNRLNITFGMVYAGDNTSGNRSNEQTQRGKILHKGTSENPDGYVKHDKNGRMNY